MRFYAANFLHSCIKAPVSRRELTMFCRALHKKMPNARESNHNSFTVRISARTKYRQKTLSHKSLYRRMLKKQNFISIFFAQRFDLFMPKPIKARGLTYFNNIEKNVLWHSTETYYYTKNKGAVISEFNFTYDCPSFLPPPHLFLCNLALILIGKRSIYPLFNKIA